jgi:hypothetical protein
MFLINGLIMDVGLLDAYVRGAYELAIYPNSLAYVEKAANIYSTLVI